MRDEQPTFFPNAPRTLGTRLTFAYRNKYRKPVRSRSYFTFINTNFMKMKNYLYTLLLAAFAWPAWAQPCSVLLEIDSVSNPNGALLVTAIPNGIPPFTYIWTNGDSSASTVYNQWGSNLCVFVADASGCTATTCLFTTSPCQVDIHQIANGVLSAVGSGGTTPYTYQWSNGTVGHILQVNAPGTYCVTLTDMDGCESSDCFDYLVPPSCHVTLAIDSSNAGGIEINAFATGTAPFTFSWNTGATGSSLPVGTAGTYCVIMTDAAGCVSDACLTIQPNNGCAADIFIDSTATGLQLIAHGNGAAPFSYAWSNGSTSQVIPFDPNVSDYCVTITDQTGCTDSDCISIGNPGQCGVLMTITDNQDGTYTLVATATGTAPFSYLWNTQNLMTPHITVPAPVSAPATYCVTVVDATGCTATECVTLFASNTNCEVHILEEDSFGYQVLVAVVTPFANHYAWSSGEVTPTITPAQSGTYCVTVTTPNGCTASDCYDYTAFTGYPIQGTVLLTDPLETAALEGWAELWRQDGTSGNWTPAATAPLANDPLTLLSGYQFDEVPQGTYLVRVSLSAGSPYAGDYLPTYFGGNSVTHWTDAGWVDPANGTAYDIQLVPAQSLSGPGTIGGTVTSEGFHGGGGPRGNPLEAVDIVLYDAAQTPASHVRTDADGHYSFPDLPFGSYRLAVDIVGKNPAERWVTIGPDVPVSDNNDFQVGEEDIISQTDTRTGESGYGLLPNPATDRLSIEGESSRGGNASIRIRHLSGILCHRQAAVLQADGPWKITLELSSLPAGTYLLEVDGPDGSFRDTFVKLGR